MKKLLLLVCCLLMAMLFLPGAMASWEGLLSVDGRVTVIEPGPDTYELMISISGEGTTSPAKGTHQIDKGETVNLSANPAEGWYFDGWIVQGYHFETASEITFQMNGDIYFKAIFLEIIPPGKTGEITPEHEEETDDPAAAEEPASTKPENNNDGQPENGGQEKEPGPGDREGSKEGGSVNGGGEGNDQGSADNQEPATAGGDTGAGAEK